MRLGLHYWNFSTPADPALIAPTLADTARIAEQAGYRRFTVMDHYFQMATGQTRLRIRCWRGTRRSVTWQR